MFLPFGRRCGVDCVASSSEILRQFCCTWPRSWASACNRWRRHPHRDCRDCSRHSCALSCSTPGANKISRPIPHHQCNSVTHKKKREIITPLIINESIIIHDGKQNGSGGSGRGVEIQNGPQATNRVCRALMPIGFQLVVSTSFQLLLFIKRSGWGWKNSEKCRSSHLYDVVVSSRLMRLVIFGVFEQHFVHVGGGVLEQLVGAAEDDQSDLAVAQHRQLVGFLHQTEFALGERHLHSSSSSSRRRIQNRFRVDAKREHKEQTHATNQMSKTNKEKLVIIQIIRH